MRCSLAFALALVGCGRPAPDDPPPRAAEPPAEVPVVAPEPGPPGVALERVGPEQWLTEVVLDPRGEAALTLDHAGTVLLWPRFDADDPVASTPYRLPTREPAWMSLAKHEAGGFVVGLIDTANVARVYRVEHERIVELFSLPPSEPQLELHVLDGGERILSLGIDHRIRLFDAHGAEVSAIDERSFMPWQLRVVGGIGEPPKLAAVLAAPSRVQAIDLIDDRLALRGEPHAVELDRGPNRNDLALSPDGKTVAALRRPSAKARAWTIELVDLDGNARRLIGGKSKAPIRPRMHFVAPDRILLETGAYEESGLDVDLGQAVVLDDRDDAQPDSRLAKRLAKLEHPARPFWGTGEWRSEFSEDRGHRFDSTVVHGVRAQFSNGIDFALIIDPIADPEHLELEYRRTVSLAALDEKGERVAWVDDERLYVERLADHELREIAWFGFSLSLAAWMDDDHVLLAGTNFLRVYSVSSGESQYAEVRPNSLPLRLGVASPGVFVLEQVDAVQRVEVSGGILRSVRALDDNERRALSCTDVPCQRARDGTLIRAEPSHRSVVRIDAEAEPRHFELPMGEPVHVSLSPDGDALAVVLKRHETAGVLEASTVLVVLDVRTGTRLWTRGLSGIAEYPNWSGDGRLLALVHDGTGLIFATETGDLVHTRRSTLRIERVQDAW